MALDTKQKRMAAIYPGCPWRGPMVHAAVPGFEADQRAAAAFMASSPFFVEIVVTVPPSTSGVVYGPTDGKPRKARYIPPPRAPRKRRKRPEPPVREPTPEEIAARQEAARAVVERVYARRVAGEDRAVLSALGAPDPMAGDIPGVNWDSIAVELRAEQQRLVDEEEAEILLAVI